MGKLSQEYEDLPPTPVVAKALLEYAVEVTKAARETGLRDYTKADQAALGMGACLLLKCMIRDEWVKHIHESTK